jgi:hypothetical protein
MKSSFFKRLLYVLVVALVVLQFFQSHSNTGSAYSNQDISSVVPVSDEVKKILEVSCNDCHSNQTSYPWYTYIQPIGMWINHHVDEGKHELNFTEFASYKRKKQLHKLDEVVEMVQEHEMPLASYTWIHSNATLTDAQAQVLIDWAKALIKDSIPK